MADPFIFDSFTDTSTTALESHTGETGASWTKHGSYSFGAAVITNANRIRTEGTTAYYASGVPADAAYRVQGDLLPKSLIDPSSFYLAIQFATAADTMYAAGYNYNVGTSQAHWTVFKRVAGSTTVLATAAAALTLGNTYLLRLSSDGNGRLIFKVNGQTVVDVTDENSPITATNMAGIRALGSGASDTAGFHLDNFRADDGLDETAPTLASAAVEAGGITILLTFSESVNAFTTPGNWTIASDGAAVTVASVIGGGLTWRLRLSRPIASDETLTLDYAGTSVCDGIGNKLAAINDQAVTNNSGLTDAQVAYGVLGYGAFFHYGIYNYTGTNDGTEDPDDFAPTDLDIGAWLDPCVAAGMQYAFLTTKHEGGFCLWDTAATTFGINSSAWFTSTSRDIVEEFANACRARGLGVGLYYSINDLNWIAAHPEYTTEDYTAFVVAQLTELLTDYGQIDYIFTDIWWWEFEDYEDPVDWATVRAAITNLQPNCLLLENNQLHTLTNSDVSVWERPVAGDIPATNVLLADCLDTCWDSATWHIRSPEENIITAATVLARKELNNGRGGNYTLNFGPNAAGVLSTTQLSLLADLDSTLPTIDTESSAVQASGTETRIVFSEPMDEEGTGGLTLFRVTGTGLDLTYTSLGDLTDYTWIDSTTLSVTHAQVYADEEIALGYTQASGSLTDVAGNELAGIGLGAYKTIGNGSEAEETENNDERTKGSGLAIWSWLD